MYIFFSTKLSSVDNFDNFGCFSIIPAAFFVDFFNQFVWCRVVNPTKHNVFTVQFFQFCDSDKELRSIGICPLVCHRQHTLNERYGNSGLFESRLGGKHLFSFMINFDKKGYFFSPWKIEFLGTVKFWKTHTVEGVPLELDYVCIISGL